MNKEDSVLRIGKKAFIQSACILLALMVVAGFLTLFIPSGSFETELVEGRTVIIPGSFQLTEPPDYPIWRWFTAPLEVLWGPDAPVIITIIIVLLLIGGSFSLLDKAGVLKALISGVISRFGQKKYLLLAIIVLFFMLFGALLGIFEEFIILVPLMIALAYLLGWDAMTGLGMSLLAVAFGFSAALANPFTIGIAQRLAELPVYSGIGLRAVVFITIYAILSFFLIRYAKKIEDNPTLSPVYNDDTYMRSRFKLTHDELNIHTNPGLRVSLAWFITALIIIVIISIGASFIHLISGIALPLVGLVFLIGGVGASLLSGMKTKDTLSIFIKSLGGIAPAIILILMAVSVKHIMTNARVMDTILDFSVRTISGATTTAAALLVYGVVLVLNFFIGSASAKAFLIIPIIAPLVDLVGVTRQTAVLAFAFGDGFSNVLFPTNAALLIALGLAGVSYIKWFRWVIVLQLVVLIITISFVIVAVTLNYGPF
ncbi:MAG: hypothetical protein SCJ97_00595 [Bacillota bacterium]|nr:hypothetical protein [Bacillota bacterium]